MHHGPRVALPTSMHQQETQEHSGTAGQQTRKQSAQRVLQPACHVVSALGVCTARGTLEVSGVHHVHRTGPWQSSDQPQLWICDSAWRSECKCYNMSVAAGYLRGTGRHLRQQPRSTSCWGSRLPPTRKMAGSPWRSACSGCGAPRAPAPLSPCADGPAGVTRKVKKVSCIMHQKCADVL